MKVNNLKWEEAFEMGQFRMAKAFCLKHGVTPNRYSYDFCESSVDLTASLEAIKEAYPNAIFVFKEAQAEKEEDEKEDHELFTLIKSSEDPTAEGIEIYDDNFFCSIEERMIIIYYRDIDPKKELEKLFNVLTIKKDENESTEVQLVAFDQNFYTITSEISPTTIDIKKNYNDDFQEEYKRLKDFLDNRSSGIALLWGSPGTGKSNLLRHLITNHPKSYIIVTNQVAEHLGQPEFISFLLSYKDSIFILEDCERVLVDRMEGTNMSGALANILQMSDGLASDIFNTKFICTFNTEITNIDPALLRKGRCHVRYKFEKLCEEKTKVLLNERGITLDKYEPLTLAEIYHYEDPNYSEDNNTIGFI